MKPRLVTAFDASPSMNTGVDFSPAPELITALAGLVPSTEPNVVMSSIARLSVPVFSQASEVWLSEGLEQTFRVGFPQGPDDEGPDPDSAAEPRDRFSADDGVLTTRFDLRADGTFAAFAGVITHRWSGRLPNEYDALIAEFLVGYAISELRYARLEESAHQSNDRAGKLTQESMASRAIGEATGVVMATLDLSRQEALALLRVHSRKTGVELHDAAIAIAGAGALPGKLLRIHGGTSSEHDQLAAR